MISIDDIEKPLFFFCKEHTQSAGICKWRKEKYGKKERLLPFSVCCVTLWWGEISMIENFKNPEIIGAIQNISAEKAVFRDRSSHALLYKINGENWPITIRKYFYDIKELIEHLDGNLSNCDLSKAVISEEDMALAKEYGMIDEILTKK